MIVAWARALTHTRQYGYLYGQSQPLDHKQVHDQLGALNVSWLIVRATVLTMSRLAFNKEALTMRRLPQGLGRARTFCEGGCAGVRGQLSTRQGRKGEGRGVHTGAEASTSISGLTASIRVDRSIDLGLSCETQQSHPPFWNIPGSTLTYFRGYFFASLRKSPNSYFWVTFNYLWFLLT